MPTPTEFLEIRRAIASLDTSAGSDAIGAHAPRLDEIYAPDAHAAALDIRAPIVLGARGTGKSFWAGVLGQDDLRGAADQAYPHLGLARLRVKFGYTGIEGPTGVGRDKLDACLPPDATSADARAFFWATVLRALAGATGSDVPELHELMNVGHDIKERERRLSVADDELQRSKQTLLIIYDALDTVAITWPRRHLLTQALLEVVWAMRAYRAVRVKLFLRPDQIEDDSLQFVELPKLRTGAVRLTWSKLDLYGLLFARLAMGEAQEPFGALLTSLSFRKPTREQLLQRQWPLSHSEHDQRALMTALAGPYMGEGEYAYKKGDTYDWPLKHLSDAFDEVTPRSFLGLMIAAAKHGPPPTKRVLTSAGIQHGLRAASKTRVDQLHQEFPWIKGVLTPLAGLLLPQDESKVHNVWKKANTLQAALEDSRSKGYLPPVQPSKMTHERDLYAAMEKIGVMLRRKDGRIDMPDLFRVAAKLLKKGATAPL
jgi:hypothetical protein